MILDSEETVEMRRAFIMGCELPQIDISAMPSIASISSRSALSSEPQVPEDGAVVANNLMVFDDGVSDQNRQDILDSYLLASLVADKAFNRESNRLQWYTEYRKVLTTLGWASTRWNYSRYQTKAQGLTLDQVALEIVGSAIAAAALPGPGSAKLLSLAGDGVSALQKSGKPLALFEKSSRSESGAGFQMGICFEDAGGTVTVAMGAVNFSAKEKVQRVLFCEYKSSALEIYRAQDGLVFNARLYAQIRDAVQKKLGRRAEELIEQFEI